MGRAQKQMLYLSVQGEDAEPHLRLEMEPYYPRENRRIHTAVPIDTHDAEILRCDDVFLDKVGLCLTLGLLVSLDFKDESGRSWAQIVYPHHRTNGQAVLRLDEEYYDYKPYRAFCTNIPLPSLDVDERDKITEEFKRLIARTVLDYLPLDINHG